MGLAALIDYYRRKKGLEDFAKSTEDQWNFFKNDLEIWDRLNIFDKKAESIKWFRQFRTLMKKKSIML